MNENESKNLIIEWYNKEKQCIIEWIKDVNINPSYQRYKDLIERLKEIDKILEKLI